mgnify:CR=1 FL=1
MSIQHNLFQVNVLGALGVEIVYDPTAGEDEHILNQYVNKSNPRADYFGTAEQIMYACDSRFIMVFAGAHTGGTLGGLVRKIKQKCPRCLVRHSLILFAQNSFD